MINRVGRAIFWGNASCCYSGCSLLLYDFSDVSCFLCLFCFSVLFIASLWFILPFFLVLLVLRSSCTSWLFSCCSLLSCFSFSCGVLFLCLSCFCFLWPLSVDIAFLLVAVFLASGFLYFSYSCCLSSALLVVVVCFTLRDNSSASSLLDYDALVSCLFCPRPEFFGTQALDALKYHGHGKWSPGHVFLLPKKLVFQSHRRSYREPWPRKKFPNRNTKKIPK